MSNNTTNLSPTTARCARCEMQQTLDERNGDESVNWQAVARSLAANPHTCDRGE